MEALNKISKVCLFVALVLMAGLSIRSAIIAAEKARMLEAELMSLRSDYSRLHADVTTCYDELAIERRAGRRR
jgi:hypothetical protein